MFLGTHFPKLDDKGRLFLPAKFRDELAEGLVVTRGQERSLFVWPEAEFIQMTEQLKQAPITNKGARDYLRMLFAGATKALRTSSRALRKSSERSCRAMSTLKGSWMRPAKNPASGRSASPLPR